MNNKKTTELIQKYFGKDKWKEKFLEQKDRLKEPKHHGSTVQIVRKSDQADVAMLNFIGRLHRIEKIKLTLLQMKFLFLILKA